MRPLLALVSALPFAQLALATPPGKVSHITLRKRAGGHEVLVDSFGRERAFHGTNVIVKGPPWLPSRDGFDGQTSLTAEDFHYMQSAGLNVIRLGVMWAGAEPERGEYNETYLRAIRDLSAQAAQYGIYTLADMHQDVLSEKFCGEGIPLWASQPDESRLPFPVPLGLHPYERDPDTQLPTRQACANHDWPSYYASFATGSAYDRLYLNHDNLTHAWGAFWAKVAETYGKSPELLGYNLINEPFVGNPYEDPLLLIPNVGDRLRLQPAYDILNSHLRKVDPEGLVFFSGCTWDRTGREVEKALPLGFEHPPGGADFANRSVSSFHFYIPPQAAPDAKEYFQMRLEDAQKLGTGLFLTESCCKGFFDIAAGIAESMGVSWMHWEWKDFCKETAETNASKSQNGAFGACKTGFGAGPFPNGTFNATVLYQLARPFAAAIAGNFTEAAFNETSNVFTLRYAVDNSIKAPTEVHATKVRYPHGFHVDISPNGVVKLTETVDGFHLYSTGEAKFGQIVDVRVTPLERTPKETLIV
mmetsp:Transcript_69703/g.167327  ORF Transcript_69703/g.167327 Transcript_69703/m.167327 type:complete len:530 (-) Transcript_69703:13-1602(-)